MLSLYGLIYKSPGLFSRLRREVASLPVKDLSANLLRTFGASEKLVRHCLSPAAIRKATVSAEKTLRWLEAPGHHLLLNTSPHYPVGLKAIDLPPPLLLVAGQLPAPETPCLSIVGSRKPTRSGYRTAGDLARALAGLGFCIVSGLARGIDTGAHEGALAGNGHTLAVLGTGMDVSWPGGQALVRSRIIETGAIITEFPMGAPPLAAHFPRRNRVVTGLSLGTVIVEAGLKSGSMISARLAADQGREVFAVPGSIYASQSRGCHALIRQGAVLVESVDDILAELRGGLSSANSMQAGLAPRENMLLLDEEESALLTYLDTNPVSTEELTRLSGLPSATVASTLVRLEIMGLVYHDLMGYALEPEARVG